MGEYKKLFFYDLFDISEKKRYNIYVLFVKGEKCYAKKILEKNWNVNIDNSMCI